MSYIARNLQTPHCFFGSSGGVSGGKYASLNTNFNSLDEKENVRHNLEIIAGHFGLTYKNMFTVHQGVSNIAVFAESPSQFMITADGVVTTTPGLLLGIKTADCAPVLLADVENGVIGAAHAGWRGAYRGIVENVLALMLQHGAEKTNIAAAIGPCLQKESFEVRDDMRAEFLRLGAQNIRFFTPRNDKEHFLFDLSGYLEDKLYGLGIKNVVNSRINTYPTKSGYFSYRRCVHQKNISEPKDYPTQYSCIRL